ncbi:eukaryotic translation initiation factor-like protein 3 subunit B [Saccharata proteae CBS 121410]|uniref:Eukaryotic translation initiation factor 3 subunit B n=1 Tax=Saccharata proteae CBS 121410 TaxID=1314787 RepID=A0A9P4I1G9_9PEZI|nr:eukaryotic translation initiation factor-like protein 3 subunit B [Saccharata proteae CBS 121410]
MAPSYDNLANVDDEFDENEIDFSDLKEQYEVRLEEGLDAFVVIDGLPVVPEESRQKLVKFLMRKLNTVGKVSEDGVFMPVNEKNMTEGYAFVEFGAAAEAVAAVKALHGTPLDKKHTILVNKLTDVDRYGREGRVEEEYVPPTIEPFQEKEHLRSWLADPRDQIAMYRDKKVGVFWNEKDDAPDPAVDREHWTELFIEWSPLGTYLMSVHEQGIQLWGGKSWSRQKRFAHPGVKLINFSPNEKYIVTWSPQPLQVDENHPVPGLSIDDDGKNYVIWDIATGKPLRSFVTIDLPPSTDEDGAPVKKKLQWPTFKWSADDKYVARMVQGQSISIYETPRMNLMDKASIKIEGIMDFEWAPATPQREGIKTYEQLLCYWTPEMGSAPAKVGLMTIPSKEVVRTRNLFNVADAKLHWQSDAAYVCVKVDIQKTKSKKSMTTNLEIFRIREKGVPVEVIDSVKDTVINFAWEPKGNRFCLITTGDLATPTAVAPKTAVAFFCPEKAKGNAVGNFKHIRTIEKKNSNAIYWSPKGRFVVVATLHSQVSCDLDFWDLDFEGVPDEKDKDLTANLQLMATAEHYGVTGVEWDPSGRYVGTVSSAFMHPMENGYKIFDFKGQLLREEAIDRFKQFVWRPRPATLLSKDEQKKIRKNLREYSRIFDEQDLAKKNTANRAVVEKRQRQLEEWLAWRSHVVELLEEDAVEVETSKDADEGEEVIEEMVEEIIEESEEVMS